jgi:RimJ/RimL family protein N-acetyltransferase
MTDPTDSLNGFQKALEEGELRLHRGELDHELSVLSDRPQGAMRMTYARIQDRTVTALAVFVLTEPIEGLPCFQLGIAVPEAHRRQGRAKSIVEAAIAEMKNGFSRNKIPAFYVEAIVGADNVASQRVAAATLSDAPTAVTDQLSGLPALQYLRKVG